jgi:hypothetical protein
MKLAFKSALAHAIVVAFSGNALAQDGSKATAAPLPSPTSIEIPEPGDFALFMIGVAGLIVGRLTSRSRKRNQQE